MKRENAQLLFDLLCSGQGYNVTVEEYIEGCTDVEEARIQATEKIQNGYIWFGECGNWHNEFTINDIKNMESAINHFSPIQNDNEVIEYFLKNIQ